MDHHALRIVYGVTIEGGALRHEIGGSTDRAGWFPLDRVNELHHAAVVDVGLAMHRPTVAVPDGRRRYRTAW